MTLFEAYVIFGIPLVAIAIAGAALWLTDRSAKKLDEQRHAAE
jgi:hypothetical protein